MRRSNQEIQSREQIDQIIRQAEVIRLGLCRDNHPYVVPLSFGYDGERIYFHTAREGLKIDMVLANPQVCFEMEQGVKTIKHEHSACSWSCDYKSVIGFGTVEEVTDSERRTYALNQVMRHYSDRDWDFDPQSFARTRVWQISIEQISGKQSKGI